MAIEGPLRELGIHDVFQLLDLSRKTGKLRVVSELRDNEGTVSFDRGKVTSADIKSNPHPLGQLLLRAGKVTEADLARARGMQSERGDPRRLGEILVSMGSVSQREMERQVRRQIEAVVFELMSWREGFFSFSETAATEVAADAAVKISTESLLMEGARRIDEWSRIADKVPNLLVVPVLAAGPSDGDSTLDLLPNEWEVLAGIDGTTDLRGLASALARSEFDVARIVYGLLSTGVIDLKKPERTSGATMELPGDSATYIEEARRVSAQGRLDVALEVARQAVAADSASGAAHLAVAEVLLRMGRVTDAAETLRVASDVDPLNSDVHRLRGTAAAARGDFDEAVSAWSRFLELAPPPDEAARFRAGLEAVAQLRGLVEELTHD